MVAMLSFDALFGQALAEAELEATPVKEAPCEHWEGEGRALHHKALSAQEEPSRKKQRRARNAFHFYYQHLLRTNELHGSQKERMAYAGRKWRALAPEARQPYLQQAELERAELKAGQDGELAGQQLVRQWLDRGVAMVVFAAQEGVKREMQEVQLFEECRDSNPVGNAGLAVHCNCCGVLLLPESELPCCPRQRGDLFCGLTLRSVYLHQGQWHVPPERFVLDDAAVDDLSFRLQLPEVLGPQALEQPLQKLAAHVTVSTAAQNLLLRSAEQYVSAFCLRSQLLADHRGKRKIAPCDIEMSKFLNDPEAFEQELRVHQSEARQEEETAREEAGLRKVRKEAGARP